MKGFHFIEEDLGGWEPAALDALWSGLGRLLAAHEAFRRWEESR